MSRRLTAKDRHGGLEGGRALLGEFGYGLHHAVHLEAAQHDEDGPRWPAESDRPNQINGS
ncbi:MAG: hypothetical protein U1D69_08745 [Polynucleobacter sp.]|nr:hypothetical protein [Polynucleobacter sp.]